MLLLTNVYITININSINFLLYFSISQLNLILNDTFQLNVIVKSLNIIESIFRKKIYNLYLQG